MLDEAIKEYEEALHKSGHQRWFHLSKKATQLGIEALEREKRARDKSPSGSRFRLLPSETEEENGGE